MNKDPKYIVNKKEKIVICIISGCAFDPYIEVSKVLPKYIHLSIDEKDSKHFTINNTYTGKAKCLPEDEFDETVGKDLAFEKAYSKYLHAKHKAAYRMQSYLDLGTKSLSNYLWYNKKFDRIYKENTTKLGTQD